MNRIFKVVFNRERGTSMVVNEATGSTQVGKKAAITVAVTGVLMALAGSASATTNTTTGKSYFGFDGTQVIGQAEGFSAQFGNGAITVKGDAKELGPVAHGIFSNFYLTEGNNLDQYAFGVTVANSDIQNAKSNNRGGAMTLWHDGNNSEQVPNKVIASKFTNNSATNDGGAISFSAYGSFEKRGLAEISDSTFQGNSAQNGGAVSLESVVLTVNNSKFEKNKATTHGGAIYVDKLSDLTVVGGTQEKHSSFVENHADGQGGAIFNNGTLNVGDHSQFIGNSSQIGGAISNNGTGSETKVTASIGDFVVFQKNHSEQQGGAIHNQRAHLNIGNGVSFENNIANGYGGGAIYQDTDGIETSLKIGSDAKFLGNETKTSHGGAIMSFNAGSGASVEIGDRATFLQNKAAKNGGALALYGDKATIGSGAIFDSNTAGQNGGALYNENYGKSAILKTGTADFLNNHAELQGGAIFNNGTLNVGANSHFIGNSSQIGGAISNNGTGSETKITASIGDFVVFQKNHSEQQGGAIHNQRAHLNIGNGVSFENNIANGYGGGAIYQDTDGIETSLKIGSDAKFLGNETKTSHGGAIMSFNAGSGAGVEIGDRATFLQNKAAKNGGALALYGDNATIGSYASFDGNMAGQNGGAIYIDNYEKSANLALVSGNFTNNSAKELGGAIYNNGTLSLSGDNVFANNSDKNGANDIFNAGTLKVISGTTTLNSGLNGTDDSKVELAKEATLAVGGQTSIAMLSGEEGATLSVLSTDVEVKKNEIQNLKLTASGEVNDELKGDVQALTEKIGKGDNGSIGLVQMAQGDVIGAITMDKDGNITEATNTKTVAVAETVSLMPSVVTRVMMNDLRKRMGDVRASEDQYGAWARYNGGELSGQHMDSDFHMIQVGFDTKAISDSIRLGAAFSYANVDSDAEVNSKSDNYSLAAYGIWTGDNGQFIDVIGRIASIKTDLDDIKGNTSDMSNKDASLSGEFGWRFDLTESVYVEPSVEATYTYMDGDSFKLGNAQYKADSVDSLIGRAGFAAGFKCPANKGDVYVRGAVVHEFLGDTDLSVNSGLRTYSMDGQDTWFEYAIGANVNLNKSTYVYADVERTSGAEMDEDWRANIGVRYSF